ncbi:MAG: twin-arginine translocation signal domain-containing protein, partial [Bacteroidota bacterium]
MHHDIHNIEKKQSRRNFLTKTSLGLGAMALGSLIGGNLIGQHAAPKVAGSPVDAVLNNLPHFAPKAKRIVYLFMSGGPS